MTSSNARIGREAERGLREVLREHRAWWLLPMVGVWLLFLGVVWFSQGEQAEPFLYSLF
jgi:hypothetical protein